MQGRYITPYGILQIDMFDEENKMVRIHSHSGQYRWFHEGEYSSWQKETHHEPGLDEPVYIPDIPAQMEEEKTEEVPTSITTNGEPKKKTVKKRTNASTDKK